MNIEPIQIVLSGEPIAAGRPRFRNVHTKAGGNFVSAYTPASTRNYQRDLRFRAQHVMGQRGLAPLTGPLAVEMDIWLRIPKSMPQKRKNLATAGELQPMTRPDLDNYIKQLDALNGICWLDDSQIVTIRATKWYAVETPCVVISIEPIKAKQERTLFEGKA